MGRIATVIIFGARHFLGLPGVRYCKRQNFCEDLFSRISRIACDSRKIGPANIRAICQHYGSYIRFAKIRTRK
ncbi:MAG: hypothetical protein PV344_04725, partial [Anaplasma sp.]|nr:hypothetical protein [Anaplasma sp.]